MRCVVTGKTRMNNGNICMSLYSLEDGRYIRPLKYDGRNFTEAEVNHIELYSIVEIVLSAFQKELLPPHVEDTLITSMKSLTGTLNPKNILEFLENIAVNASTEIFGFNEYKEENLILDKRNWGVRPNSGKRSFGTLKVQWLNI